MKQVNIVKQGRKLNLARGISVEKAIPDKTIRWFEK
tara:strand:- start:441 stop:548 length:108 start_codon:yes stop_codon:yes gene_type:complete